MQLSPHFSLEELCKSQTATRRGLDNTPPPEAVDSLRALCANVLEPLRALLGKPIHVSSGYRSPEVNKAVGGSKNSQHLRGEAVDFTVPGLTTQQVFDVIRASDLPFDQLIQEGTWIHVSHAHARKQRQECLIAHFGNGGTRYTVTSRRPAIIPSLPNLAPPRKKQVIPLAAPNDEFGTVTKPPISTRPNQGTMVAPPPPPSPRIDPGVYSSAGLLPERGTFPVFDVIWDRLFGTGANTTGWAAALLGLVTFWGQISEAAAQVGIVLPQNKQAWFALALAVGKLIWSKAK